MGEVISMDSCDSRYGDNGGLCRFKFLGGDKVYCMCKDKDKLTRIRCVEEGKQLILSKRRWKSMQKRGYVCTIG